MITSNNIKTFTPYIYPTRESFLAVFDKIKEAKDGSHLSIVEESHGCYTLGLKNVNSLKRIFKEDPTIKASKVAKFIISFFEANEKHIEDSFEALELLEPWNKNKNLQKVHQKVVVALSARLLSEAKKIKEHTQNLITKLNHQTANEHTKIFEACEQTKRETEQKLENEKLILQNTIADAALTLEGAKDQANRLVQEAQNKANALMQEAENTAEKTSNQLLEQAKQDALITWQYTIKAHSKRYIDSEKDTVIKCMDKEILAHSAILRQVSIFAEKLSFKQKSEFQSKNLSLDEGEKKEKVEKENNLIYHLELKEYKSHTFNLVLDHLYQSKFPSNLTLEDLIELDSLAHYLRIEIKDAWKNALYTPPHTWPHADTYLHNLVNYIRNKPQHSCHNTEQLLIWQFLDYYPMEAKLPKETLELLQGFFEKNLNDPAHSTAYGRCINDGNILSLPYYINAATKDYEPALFFIGGSKLENFSSYFAKLARNTFRGGIYFQGGINNLELIEGIKNAEKAKGMGNHQGNYMLAVIYEWMADVKIDPSQNKPYQKLAFENCLAAAERGNIFATVLVAQFYKKGYGTFQNDEKAIEWAKKGGTNESQKLLRDWGIVQTSLSPRSYSTNALSHEAYVNKINYHGYESLIQEFKLKDREANRSLHLNNDTN